MFSHGVCTPCVCLVPKISEEDIGSSRTRVMMDGCKPSCGCRELSCALVYEIRFVQFLWYGQYLGLASVTLLTWLLCLPYLTDNLKNHPAVPDQSPCLLPGFRVLNDFLGYHVLIPEVYLIVSAFFLQMPLTELTDGPRVCSGCTPGEERRTSLSNSI